MSTCDFRHVVRNENSIVDANRMVATHGGDATNFGWRKPRQSSIHRFLICFAVMLILAADPVCAFSSPRTSVISTTKNHTVLLGATTSTTEANASRLDRLKIAYRRRTNADPSFFAKSVTEVLVAAGTQLMAEWNRRGASGMVRELDFVLPAVLTAVFGKYYSMWRTAKTLDDDTKEETVSQDTSGDPMIFGLSVPNNVFQPKMADGTTRPTWKQRVLSLLAPCPSLFRAGTIASGVGYGIATILIALRTWLVPSYRSSTVPVNVLYASVYTGCFMAVVSNLRYQILQGLVEPVCIDRWIFRGKQDTTKSRRWTRSMLIFTVRWLNGLLGSVLAITGMRMCGLQRLKST